MYEQQQQLPPDLILLLLALEDLPEEWRKHLIPSVDKLTDSVMRRRRILSMVQENVEELVSQVKYLIFDLKCTRQERDEALAI